MASSAARGVTSIQRGVVREGIDHQSSRGQTSSTPLRGSAPQPGDPARDAEPLGQTLQLLLRGAVPTTVMRPPADQLHAGAEQQVESLLGNEPADEADGEAGVRGAWACRAAAARRPGGWCGGAATGWPRSAEAARELVDRDQPAGAGERAVPPERGERAVAETGRLSRVSTT